MRFVVQIFCRVAVFVVPSGIIIRYPDILKAVKYSVKRSVGVTQSNTQSGKVFWTTNTIGGHVIFL